MVEFYLELQSSFRSYGMGHGFSSGGAESGSSMKGLSGFAALSARVVTLKGMGLPELGSAQAQLSAVQVGADQGLND